MYDNFGKNERLALALDAAVRASRQDDWRTNHFKVMKVLQAIKEVLKEFNVNDSGEMKEAPPGYAGEPAPLNTEDAILELVKKQHDY